MGQLVCFSPPNRPVVEEVATCLAMLRQETCRTRRKSSTTMLRTARAWPDLDSFQAHLEGTKTLGMIWTFSRIKRISPALHACRPAKGAVQHKAVAVASAQGSPAGMLPALGLRHVPSSSNRPLPSGLLLLPCLTEVLFDLP